MIDLTFATVFFPELQKATHHLIRHFLFMTLANRPDLFLAWIAFRTLLRRFPIFFLPLEFSAQSVPLLWWAS